MPGLNKNNLLLAAAATLGYSFFWATSHPKSKFHHTLAQRKKTIKNIDILPSIKIARPDKTYHLHHWINLASLYIVLHTARNKKIIGSKLLRSFILGGILQGLSYQDRFKIVHPVLQQTVNEE